MGVMCLVCEKIFSTQFNLNKHNKKVHNLEPKIVSYDQSKWNYKCLESDCNSSFQHNIGLRTHLSEDHHLQMQTETMEFSNKEEFLAWKNEIERTDKSNYIVARTSKLKNKPVTYYLCNRSGKVRSRSLNKRLPKTQGSCKLNRYCTSMIKVIEADRVLVTWMKTHYGHNPDLQHIRLPKMDNSVLLKYIGDKSVNRHVNQIKGKHTIRVKQMRTRHIAATSSQFIVVPDKKNSNTWFISTLPLKQESQETCRVQKLFDQSCCDQMCKECSICCHTYSCTCNDFCIANSICKHIHYIEIKYYPKTVLQESELLLNQKNDCEINSTEYVEKSDHLREKFSAKKISTMSKLQNADKRKLDEGVILQIQCHLDTIDKLLDLPCTSSQSFSPITHNEPQTKKNMKQVIFFSSQKKKEEKRSNCNKPTDFDMINISKDIKSNFCELYISHSLTEDHNYL